MNLEIEKSPEESESPSIRVYDHLKDLSPLPEERNHSDIESQFKSGAGFVLALELVRSVWGYEAGEKFRRRHIGQKK